ncbi:MAG: hypothetical protein FWD15_05250 [Alphaproteobacteria bacterium]|nr:hypothetical protein [Alphaproteobacteria bacterium]
MKKSGATLQKNLGEMRLQIGIFGASSVLADLAVAFNEKGDLESMLKVSKVAAELNKYAAKKASSTIKSEVKRVLRERVV